MKSLITQLNEKLEKSWEEYGTDHPNTIAWGRALDQAIDNKKHGTGVDLPLHLYYRMKSDLIRIMPDDENDSNANGSARADTNENQSFQSDVDQNVTSNESCRGSDANDEDDGWGRRGTDQRCEGNGEVNGELGRHDTQGLEIDDTNGADNDGWGRHDNNHGSERYANNGPPNEDNDGWGKRETNQVNCDANEDVSGNELYSDNDIVEEVAAAGNEEDSSDLFSEDDTV